MSLTNSVKRQYKSIGHHLNPIVIISENGLTEGVLQELERAINDHELIKIKIAINDRDDRAEIINETCSALQAEKVQTIGKMLILFRKNPKPNPKLSNLIRYSNHAE
jgi:RNA-binding protein